MARLYRIYGALIPLLLLSSHAMAQNNEITLSCKGTVKEGKDDPVAVTNMGLVVNLTTQTVRGFGSAVAKIFETDDVHISFTVNLFSDKTLGPGEVNLVSGSMDRITGYVTAMTRTTYSTSLLSQWELVCTPAKRLF